MIARTRVLMLSADKGYRDLLRWAIGEVADDVVVAAKWGALLPMLKEHAPSALVLDVDAIPCVGRGFVAHQLTVRYHVPVVTIGTGPALRQIAQYGIAPGVPKPLELEVVMGRVASIVGAGQDS